MPENISETSVRQTIGENIKGEAIFEQVTQIGSQTVIQGEIAFQKVSLSQFESEEFLEKLNLEKFKSSDFLNQILTDSNNHNIIFFAKDRKIKKAELARLVAYILREKSNNQILSVKESIRNSNIGLNLQIELHNTEKPSIFILPDISFKTLGSPLDNIRDIAKQKQHYVICTTDEPKETWQPSNNIPFYENLFDELQNYQYLINELSEENLILKWYETLESHEKLLAISLSLFDNFYGNQFFAALEQLVERVWQQRDSRLRSLDYCDLRTLYTFFSFSGKNEQDETVEVTSSRERRLLLKISWKSHRRQIINALPILVNLVKGSVKYVNYELYGTEERRSKLRQVIGETISDIGLIANDSKLVEDSLLSLAAEEDIIVQAVAADALARWRSDENKEFLLETNVEDYNNQQIDLDRKFFDTIQRWQDETQVMRLVNSFLKQEENKNTKEPVDYIRSTIALTIGYASEADPYDQMSEELLTLLKQLMRDRNEFVRNRVFSDTLPRILRRHTKQIGNELKNFLQNADLPLIIAISKSLASASEFKPNEVLEILELWQNEAENNRPSKILKNRTTFREVLLATVVMTYGEFDILGAEQAFENLQKVLSEEQHPFVRSSALAAVGRQVQKHFNQVESQLQILVDRIPKDERQEVAKILAKIYIEQRFQLYGGSQTIEIKNRKYSVWLNSKRPLTDVEQAMIRWIKNDKYPMAQQVATRASANFADEFDREESQKIKELQEKLGVQPAKKEQYALPIIVDHPPQDWYLGKLIPWLVTRKAKNYRMSIRNLLPEGLFQHRKSRKNINFVLQKWRDYRDIDIKTISSRLKPGILLAETVKWGIAGTSLIFVGLVTIGIKKLTEPSPLPPLPIDPGIRFSERIGINDVDSPNFDKGQLIVQFAENGTSNDRLGIHSQGRDKTQINLRGREIAYGSDIIGEVKGGKGTTPLVISFNSNANAEAVNALIRSITYHNILESPELGLRKVEFQVTDDAGAKSNSISRSIFVTQENQAPQIKVPKDQIANENTPKRISGIDFDDPDSTKKFTVTLRVNKGKITVLDTISTGLKAKDIKNNNSNNVELFGTAKQIKTTLSTRDAIIYNGFDNDLLSVSINDGGLDIPGNVDDVLVFPSEAQKAKTDQAQFKIIVNPTGKIPTITTPEMKKVVDEDQDLTIGNIAIDNLDGSNTKVVLSVKSGNLTIKSDINQGLRNSEISGNKTNRIILSGTHDKVKKTLANPQAIIYRGQSNFYGNDSLEINVTNDSGRGNTNAIAIVVNPVNDPPVLSIVENIAPPEQILPERIPPKQNSDITNATVIGDNRYTKNVRSGVTTNANVLFELPVGSRVRVISKRYNSDDYLWYKIYSPQIQKEGWIANHLIECDVEITDDFCS